MIAYQLLSLALVLPLFYRLQVALNNQIVADSASIWYRIQPKIQLILFCSIAPILLSLFEAVRISTGFSKVPVWLGNDLITLSGAFTCLPSAILGLMVAFYLHKRNYAKHIRRDEFGLYRDLLKEENFNICLLEGKTDEEINKIIDVAHSVGELEKADLMSSVLVKRHL